MSLYLCVFLDSKDVSGLDMGSYSDFNHFRMKLLHANASNNNTIRLNTLLNHSDCDGEWTSKQSLSLIKELREVRSYFIKEASPSQTEILASIDSLLELARFSVNHNSPILFQ